MTAPTPIVTSDRQVYRWGVPRCYVADALRDQDMTFVPYLYCTRLRRACGPEIDQAQFHYDYGVMLRSARMDFDEGTQVYTLVSPEKDAIPAAVVPLDLNDKFVKVIIPDTVYEDALAEDPETTVEDKTIVWFGVIKYDDRQTDGTSHPTELTYDPQGQQEFSAFGLLFLADRTPILTSHVDVDGTTDNLLISQTGINFNTDPGGQFAARGNRSTVKPVGVGVGEVDSPSYVFNFQPRGFAEWTAYAAVEYLLGWHSPKLADGTDANVWRFADDVEEDYLDWWKIAQPTHGLTLKELLDNLMPRHRGVGYWLEFDITRTIPAEVSTAANEVLVHVFTFNKTDIALTGGETLKANANQKSLDFEFAYDIDEVNIGNTSTQRYHRVVVQGAKRTTTFTARIDRTPAAAWSSPHVIGASWTTADETEYKAGASAAADYASLTTEQKQNRNAIYRASSDRLREVYRRFILNPTPGASGWDCKVCHPHKNLFSDKYWLRGDITTDPFNAIVEESEYDGTDYVQGLKILRGLPLYERTDYSGSNLASFSYDTSDKHPSFIPLMAYARTHLGAGEIYDGETANPHRYELLDRLHQKSFDGTSNRDWQARVFVVDTEPGIELHADCPHFLGGSDAAGAGWAVTADEQKSALHGGIDYLNIWVTMCVELTEHIQASAVIGEPPTNAPESVLVVSVPDARHDYVLPNTVVEIKDGIPTITTSGGAPFNSLDRLKTIADVTAQWYSTVRQTLNLGWKQVRGLFELGDLITDVGGRYQITDINTPITAIEYQLGTEHQPGQGVMGRTRIETAYTNLDFQA